MVKNLKHSILFILIVLMLLSIVAVTLAASRPVSQIQQKGISIPLDPIINGKWSGLGMGMFSWSPTSTFNGWVETLLANEFTTLRIDIPSYQDTVWLAQSKICVTSAIAKGVNVIWGVSSNSFGNSAYTITSTNWPTFRQAILDAATWAQANGVYEFQLGNEEEWHIDGTTMTRTQIITNLKSVATEVQAIFTRGNISYTSGDASVMSEWHALGRGDIDILGWNIYANRSTWRNDITNMINWWGADHTYITEFNLSCDSLDSYSTDESVQATAVAEMIDYIKVSGVTRAFFFQYRSDNFGAMKENDNYRLLWNQALYCGKSGLRQ